jgi:hypothetical protein
MAQSRPMPDLVIRGPRASISLKIFSIAVSLVALMAVVSGLSTKNIADVSSRVNTLAQYNQ